MRRFTALLAPMLLLPLFAGVTTSHALGGVTYVVDTTADTAPDSLPNNGCEAEGGNTCTLREAVLAANDNIDPVPDVITFKIGSGAHTISVAGSLGPLPSITDPVVIDGKTQPGFDPAIQHPLITIEGTTNDVSGDGLAVLPPGGGSTIKDLVILGFDRACGAGIRIAGSDGNTILGNYLGIPVSGQILPGESNCRGLALDAEFPPDSPFLVVSDRNIIGGTTFGDRNVIANNLDDGVEIIGIRNGPLADANRLIGNYIGVALVGGTPVVAGNGVTGLDGGGNGVFMDFTSHTQVGDRNVISANALDGVDVEHSLHAFIIGNRIGTDPSGGDPTFGNKGHGVSIADPESVPIVFLNEAIAYNGLSGVDVESTDNVISFNVIHHNGTSGTYPGVWVHKHDNERSTPAPVRNEIRNNSIYANSGLGIDLGSIFDPQDIFGDQTPDGVTENDPTDADDGPNNLQNFPDITGVTATSATVTLAGAVLPANTYAIEAFANDECDPSGNGEGKTFLGSANYTGAGTVVNFDNPAPGQFITTTATLVFPHGAPDDADHDSFAETSEFSDCVKAPDLPVINPPPPPPVQPDILMALGEETVLPKVGGGTLAVEDEDVVRFVASADAYQMVFDGSDVGVKKAVDGVAVDPVTHDLVISLVHGQTLKGVGQMHNEDLIAFHPTQLGDTTAGSFRMFFDGSDIKLRTDDAKENIDGVDIGPDGTIYFSTRGNFNIKSGASTLTGSDKDVVACTGPSLGSNSSCAGLAIQAHGAAVGLTTADEDIDALDIGPAGDILSTRGNYTVNGDAGTEADLFACVGTTCSRFFTGALHHLTGDLADVETSPLLP